MPFVKSVYQKRRQQLAGRMNCRDIAVIPTATVKRRNGEDNDYPFRPDSSFYYLTGFDEPEAVLVIRSDGLKNRVKSLLFCRARDSKAEVWSGKRLGPARVPETLGIDEGFQVEALDNIMVRLLEEHRDGALFVDLDEDGSCDERIFGWLNKTREGRKNKKKIPDIRDLRHELAEMRLRKGPKEIEIMLVAARISALGHIDAMKKCHAGMMEYGLETVLTSWFRRCGGDPLHAYPPIVAGGNNACTLHYMKNNQELCDGDLVLIDAGCELDGYASDITRTFPVNGRFTPEQREIYEIVLNAQRAAIEHIRPGNSREGAQKVAVRVITEELVRLGILAGEPGDLIEKESHKRFYPHNIGHWLGLDVHDVGDYETNGQPRALESGMVLTVEPGIYIPEGMEGVDPRWHGIGVRIEDDVLVTDGEPEVLSKAAPKEVDEIEKIMEKSSSASGHPIGPIL